MHSDLLAARKAEVNRLATQARIKDAEAKSWRRGLKAWKERQQTPPHILGWAFAAGLWWGTGKLPRTAKTAARLLLFSASNARWLRNRFGHRSGRKMHAVSDTGS